MHSTHLRKEHLHGLMAGVAMGDALGNARQGLSPRLALKMFGRPVLRYRLLPGRGIYSGDTQLMLLAAQAMLNSRGEGRFFRAAFQRRLRWYLLSMPLGIGRATRTAAIKCWFLRGERVTGVQSVGNGAATRAIFCALAINGTGHRLNKWIEDATKLTHTHPLAIGGCQILANLAEIAATTPMEKLEPIAVLNQVVSLSTEAEIRDSLSQLAPFLEQRRSPHAVARHFGWELGISNSIVPTTVMACYCWLRYPGDYCRAVESAIALGGDSDSLAAVVGGLAGAHLGVSRLPVELHNALGGFPQGPSWILGMADRLSHWPHGADDLHSAPSQPSDPLMQIVRNAFTLTLVAVHKLWRIPYRLTTSSKPPRLSA